jgi:hypothetical protein
MRGGDKSFTFARWKVVGHSDAESRAERMNHQIAGSLRDEELTRLRTSSYADLLNCIDKTSCKLLDGPDEKKYHVQTQVFWDGKKGGNIRVMVSVDDGGWTSIKPLTGDFIISPDGTFL